VCLADLLGLGYLPCCEIGGGWVPHFSLLDEVVEGSKCFFEGCLGVEAVEVVYVDEVCL